MGESVDAQALGLAGGVSWAVFVFLFGLAAMLIPDWQSTVQWIGQYYLGYAPTVTGSIIGAVWGFFDLFIGLYVFAWLYNYFKNNPVF